MTDVCAVNIFKNSVFVEVCCAGAAKKSTLGFSLADNAGGTVAMYCREVMVFSLRYKLLTYKL